jgi:hypothetical protein
MLYYLISQVENFKKLQDEILKIIGTVGFENNQIICQSLDENKEDFHTGVGQIADLEHKNEKSYKFINKSIKGSYLEEVITNFNGYRSRILKLNPKSCYSIHQDPSPRIHIPIDSNDQCWMVWPNHNFCLNMKPGSIYWTDTRKPHTFINCDNTLERIHLVMVIK